MGEGSDVPGSSSLSRRCLGGVGIARETRGNDSEQRGTDSELRGTDSKLRGTAGKDFETRGRTEQD